MNIGDTIVCPDCGEILVCDQFDVWGSCVFCLDCSEFVEIKDDTCGEEVQIGTGQ